MFQQNRIGNTPPIVLNLIIINALMLLLTWFFRNMDIDIIKALGLYSFYSESFRVWQPFTNIFLHADITHLFFNMFSLWMFGRILEQVWGGKKFLLFYLATGVGASILNSIVNIAEIEWIRYSIDNSIANISPDVFFNTLQRYHLELSSDAEALMSNWYKDPNNINYSSQAISFLEKAKDLVINPLVNFPTIGASGSVYGVLLAFGMLFPNMLLLLLIPPIPIKAKYMVMIFAGIELYFGFSGKQPGIAHFAHLGGMLVGYFIIRYWKKHNLMY